MEIIPWVLPISGVSVSKNRYEDINFKFQCKYNIIFVCTSADVYLLSMYTVVFSIFALASNTLAGQVSDYCILPQSSNEWTTLNRGLVCHVELWIENKMKS